MRFIGATHAAPEGVAQGGRLDVVRGTDPQQWLQGTLLYQKVRYGGIYKGIDLVYGGSSGVMKSEYLVAPGADPSQIHFQFKGADRISLSALVVHTDRADFRERAPAAYQEGSH
jgi:hypothetical protein